MYDISIGTIVSPLCDELIKVIGNRDFKITDIKEFNKITMIKIDGHKEWFSFLDFEICSYN